MTDLPSRKNRPDRACGICVGCQNQHGCLSPEPPCNTLEREPRDEDLPGREWMKKARLLARCERCALFRHCWNPEAYRRALAEADRKDRV